MRTRLGLCALALACGGALAARAQETPSGQFGERVEVRVVNVDVWVTDRDGRPVTGLERGDFVLRVDGRPVEISNFARFAEEQAPSPSPRPSPARAVAPPAAEPVPAPPAQEATRLRLAVWIDDLHTLPAHRNRVLRELGALLEARQAAGADILLARFDRALEVVRNFGAGGRPLAEDLATLSKRAASGIFAEAARRGAFDEIETIHAQDRCARIGDMYAAAARYGDPLRHDSLVALNALRGAVRSLAGLPGRRVLLYVADGLPLQPGQEAYLYVDQLCQGTLARQPQETLVNDLQRVAAEANAAGVTFYTLQAGGLPVGADAQSFGPGLDFANAFTARANLSDPLQKLASDTGGRALLESNRLAPLVEGLARDLATGYSLGFSPSGEPDGREHRIAVEVKRGGVRLRHRETFRDRLADELREARLLAALRFGRGDNPLGVTLEIDAAREADGTGALVPVRVVVPATAVLFLGDTPATSSARLEIAFAASDEAGGLSPVRAKTVAIERTKLPASLGAFALRFPVEMRLRKGHARLAALVRDLAAETESLVWADVAVR